MSVHAIRWAWDQDVGHPTRKLVLVALADHANGDGECWPTISRISEFAECSPRTVRRHIDALCDAGFVRKGERRTRSDGTFGSRNYVLPIDAETEVSSGHTRPQDTDDHGTPVTCPVDTGDRDQWTHVSAQEPPVNHQEPPPEDGEPFVKRLADELRQEHDCEFMKRETLHAAFQDLLEAAFKNLPEKRHHNVTMGLIKDFVHRVQGYEMTDQSISHTGQLVKMHDRLEVLRAYGEALKWGAGIDAEYANDPLSLSKYVAAILGRRAA